MNNTVKSESQTNSAGRKLTWRERLAVRGYAPDPDTYYTYRNSSGLSVVRKYRWNLVSLETGEIADKTFTVRHCPQPVKAPNAWESGIGPHAGKLMYRLPELIVGLRSGTDVYWCEGEKDVRNAVKAWGVIATSHHQGGAGAREGQVHWFSGTESRVFLVMDLDPVGAQIAWHHAKLLRKVVSIPGDRIIFLAPAVKKLHADITNHIEAGYGLGDLLRVSPEQVASVIKKYGTLNSGTRGGHFGSHATGEDLATIDALKKSPVFGGDQG